MASGAQIINLLNETYTGASGSDVKVNCRVDAVMRFPSVTVGVIAKLPSEVLVPEISPDTGSALVPVEDRSHLTVRNLFQIFLLGNRDDGRHCLASHSASADSSL